ncbi:MAG: AMP-binding protein [Phycisphaerae bacterium]
MPYCTINIKVLQNIISGKAAIGEAANKTHTANSLVGAKKRMQTQLQLRTLIDLFNASFKRIESLGKECLEIVRAERQEKLTFGQLKTRAQNFALLLIQAEGIQPGDKVAILGKNRADWDVALWGIILAGAVPVLIDPERPVEGVINHLTSTDTRLLVMADDYQDADSRQQLREFACRQGQGLGLIEMTDAPLYNTPQDETKLLSDICGKIEPDDTAVILCTSGTTGDPREVELTHANLIANIEGSVQRIKISYEDKLGHILPPHHSFGLTVGKLLPFCVGATNIYTNRYRQISELIRDKKVTIFVAVPALFTLLAKNIEEGLAKQKREKPFVRVLDYCLPKFVGKRIVRKQGWDKLRFFLSGSAAVPKWVLEVFWKRGLKLCEGYGTTENSPVYGFNDSHQRLGSVGKPIPTLTVQIVNEKNQIQPPGQKGEICLGGPCIMKGYYKNHGATEAVIRIDNEGIRWLHTGDLGYLDEEGHLFITGRKKYLIVLPGGKNVNPEFVESALSEARFVKEILVVPGLRKDTAGIAQETIKAIVQPAWDEIESHTNLSFSDIVEQPQVLKTLVWQSINECQQKSRQLSVFEKISSHHLEIKIDEFQKTSTGKIKREAYVKL